jgi:hypothetical protein
LGFLVAMLLVLPGSQAVAGGLVDTSTERFEAANFTNPQSITNPWWTLTEGQNFLYFAQDGEDCVWNLTEVLGTTGPSFFGPYAGTNARIVLDRGWVDEGCASGQNFAAFIGTNPPLEEVTYDWYAQDDARNIWYMGEHTFDGDFGGSFAAGCDGAEAGIVVLGDPFKGAFYRQELYEGEAEDWGKVLNFKNADGLMCMTTKEWTPLEHGRIEHKQYCSDGAVGTLSRIEELHGKTVIVELVDTNIPSPPLGVIPVNPIPSCAAP